MKHARKSTLKKNALVFGAAALAASGLMAVSNADFASASAGTGPGGAVDIRGIDPGNTDWLMEHLCGNKPEGIVWGAYNVQTGEFKHMADYQDTVFPRDISMFAPFKRDVRRPTGSWEIFSGRCLYLEASTWEILGETIRTSPPIRNRGSQPDKDIFVSGYTTKRHATTSLGGSVSVGVGLGIFSANSSFTFDREWGWEKTSSFERRAEKSIAPCTSMAITWTPIQRVVRVNPVFEIESYQWALPESKGSLPSLVPKAHPPVKTWRGRDYNRIFSFGYYIDGISDKLLPNGQPDGIEDKTEEKLDPKICNTA